MLQKDVVMFNFFPQLGDSAFSNKHEFIFVIDRSGEATSHVGLVISKLLVTILISGCPLQLLSRQVSPTILARSILPCYRHRLQSCYKTINIGPTGKVGRVVNIFMLRVTQLHIEQSTNLICMHYPIEQSICSLGGHNV